MPSQDERLERLREALNQFEHRLAQAEGRAKRCAERVPDLESSTRAGVERNSLLNGLLDMLEDAGVSMDTEPAAVRRKLTALVSESRTAGEFIPEQRRKGRPDWTAEADDVAVVTAEVVEGEPTAHSVAMVNALMHFFDER